MKRLAGPLDKRKKVTRCQACSRRRIKCEGGFPCEYCTRTKKECRPPSASPPRVEFVVVNDSTRLELQALASPAVIQRPDDNLYLDYFAGFMERCQFTKGFAAAPSDLLPLFNTSTPLKNLALAIGALEASRRGSLHSYPGPTSPQVVSLGFYGRSIKAFQKQIQTSEGIEKEDVLWTTLLLGIYELMSENSGKGWAKHMSYGTSRLLQVVGPRDHPSPLRRTLFDAFRILEANRAILYGNGSFLTEECWQSHQRGQISQLPDTMQSIVQLMLQISAFSDWFFEQLESIASDERPLHPVIGQLGRQGCSLQEQLDRWYIEAVPHMREADPYIKLAFSIYHSLVLFLSGNFGYYSCWENSRIPILHVTSVVTHSNTIINLAASILEQSNIPGPLLLFCLRIAGLNSTTKEQREEILGLLGRVRRQGFVVAEWIQTDLEQLWVYQELNIQGFE